MDPGDEVDILQETRKENINIYFDFFFFSKISRGFIFADGRILKISQRQILADCLKNPRNSRVGVLIFAKLILLKYSYSMVAEAQKNSKLGGN